MVNYTTQHISETLDVLKQLDVNAIEKMVDLVLRVKQNKGRLFFLGVGGSAANCSHAVNDFRKIVQIESYAPTDNISEITARTNDEGWSTIFVEWLKTSQLQSRDGVFVFSVGGGCSERNISYHLILALQYAKEIGSTIMGVVGRDGGYTAQVADACVMIPVVNPETITPHTEACQAIIWHLMVSHPKLKIKQTKWELSLTNLFAEDACAQANGLRR